MRVSDTGPGVADADAVFRQGYSTKAVDEEGGRGFGLALTRLVCRRRGGDVTWRNDDGAVFTATLPVVHAEELRGGDDVIEVLIVDDDFMVARIHTGFVERTPGFTVTGVAKTGAEALAAAARLQPDLVLLDVYLPDVSGLDLLGDLREAAPEVDVLVISAAREADTVRRALRGGIVHYLMKPFSYDDLRVRLEHYQQAYAAMAGEHTDQADIDRVFNIATPDRPLPKGFSAETLKLVEDTLRDRDPDAGDLSAAEAAGVLGISRVSARRYLEYLTEKGKVEVGAALRRGRTARAPLRLA